MAVAVALMCGDKVEAGDYAHMGTTLWVQIAEHSSRHQDRYRPYWTGDPDPKENKNADDGDMPTTWEAWLRSLRLSKRWICQLC